MAIATARRTRTGWRLTVQAQGRAVANVATLGDAKRAGEALAQRTLIWTRRHANRWEARLPTPDEQQRLDRAYEAVDEDA